MRSRFNSGFDAGAIRIVLLYMLFGGLWILISDPILIALVPDHPLQATASILKGWVFIGLTSVLLYWLIHRNNTRTRENQDRLKLAYEIAELGSWQYDLVSGQVELDARATSIMDLPAKATIDQVRARIHPDDQERVRQAVSGPLAAGSRDGLSGEFRVIHGNGEVRWLAVRDRSTFKGSGLERRAVSTVGSIQDITERREHEQALRQSEERFSRLFATSPAPLAVSHPVSGELLAVNANYAGLFRYTPAEMIGRTTLDLDLYVDAEDRTQLLAALRRDGSIHDQVVKMKTKGGEILDVLVSLEYTEWLENEHVILGSIVDVTARTRSERLVRQNERLLRLFVEHAPAAIAMFDCEMKYVIVSERFRTEYGLGSREIIGHSHYEIFPEIPERWKEIHRRCLAGATAASEQDPFPRADGSMDWIRWEILPWYENEEEIGGIILFSETITAQVAAREELAAHTRTMEMAQRIGHFGSWEARLTEQGEIIEPIYSSDECYRIVGLEPQSQPLTSEALLGLTHPDDRARALLAVQGALHDRSEYSHESRIIRPDGSVRYLHTQARVLTDDGADLTSRIVGTIHDITERTEASRALRQSEARYRFLFNNMTNGFAHCLMRYEQDVPVDFQYLDVNKAFETITQLGDVNGKWVSEVIPGLRETNPELFEIYGTVARSGEPAHLDSFVPALAVWFSVDVYSPQRDHFVAIFEDISERKLAEVELRNAQQFAQATLDALPSSLCVLNAQGKIVAVNALWRDFAAANPPAPADAYVGSNYLAVCDAVSGPDAAEATTFAAGLRAVLGGSRDQFSMEYRCDAPFARRWFIGSVTRFEQYNGPHLVVVHINITERKQAEEAMREIAENMALAQQIGHVGSWEIAVTPEFQFAGPALWSDECYRIFGVEPRAVEPTAEFFISHVHPEDHSRVFNPARDNLAPNTVKPYIYRVIRPDGSIRYVEDQAKLIPNARAGRPAKIAGMMRDVTEQTLAEAALRESEERYRLISSVASDYIFSVSFLATGEARHDWLVGAFEEITGYSIPEYRALGGWRAIVHPHDLPLDDIDMELLRSNQPAVRELRLVKKGGNVIWVRSYAHPVWNAEENRLQRVYGGVHDITERKQAEEALRESEERFKSIIESAMDGIITVDAAQRIVLFNAAAEKMFLYPAAQAIGQSIDQFIPDRYRQRHADNVRIFGDTGVTNRTMGGASCVTGLRGDGSEFPLEASISRIETRQGKLYTVILRDISERVAAEREIRYQASLLENVSDAIISTDVDTRIKSWNRAAEVTYGWSAAEVIGKPIDQIVQIEYSGNDYETMLEELEAKGEWRGVTKQSTTPGNVYFIQNSVSLIRDAANLASGVVTVNRDITESVMQRRELDQLSERTLLQVQRLETLHTIEHSISSTFVASTLLRAFVETIVKSKHVDAAAILLYNPARQNFNYAAASGFERRNPPAGSVSTDTGYIGRAATLRRPVTIANLQAPEVRQNDLTSLFRTEEGLVAYAALPLITKGEFKGMLEVARRSSFPDDPKWFEFLNTLAAQAAIAISNAELFTRLQKTNRELVRAYDATIEGWSRALDLRDKETEGHTQRVTALTIRLAGAYGMQESEIVHIRRGALLHDIGKMGVPDTILNKPGALDPEEWAIMRKHPQFAYEMLAEIEYLKPALDIPHYHHEKWDGTGYPSGLQGTQIPLSARLFAVVDVWDALTSDRPYRRAWSREQAREYLIDQRGKHFDPRVVRLFLGVLDTSSIEREEE